MAREYPDLVKINTPIIVVDAEGLTSEAITYDQLIVMDYQDINHVTILTEIPNEFASPDLNGTTPESDTNLTIIFVRNLNRVSFHPRLDWNPFLEVQSNS